MKNLTIEKLSGMYFLHSVKETESGFKLEKDGTFKFFFSYGALDRYGSGTWTIQDDRVVLQSRPWAGRDFDLVSSGKAEGDFVAVKIIGNPQLVSHVFVSLDRGEMDSWMKTNDQGVALFPSRKAISITMVFEFCPERYTHFTIEDPSKNYFEFRFEQWLMEVFFEKFALKAGRYSLTGRHPLLKGEKYEFEKS
jgi:hypothetical protein